MPDCHCLIRHPKTQEERRQVERALEYARSIGDSIGILLALAQLTGSCPPVPKIAAIPEAA